VKYLIYTGFLLLLATACHQKNPAGQTTAGAADTTKKNFFPVADYIRGEIRYVDSTPLAIFKYTTQGQQRTDSSLIDQAAFNGLAQEFISPDMGWDKLEKEYSEKSFMDETTGSMTFLYSTANRSLPLQRVDVLATPGASLDKIKSIYLERSFSSGDTIVQKKMYWKARQSFLIVTSLQLPGKEALFSQLKVVWDQPTP